METDFFWLSVGFVAVTMAAAVTVPDDVLYDTFVGQPPVTVEASNDARR